MTCLAVASQPYCAELGGFWMSPRGDAAQNVQRAPLLRNRN